MAQSKKSSMLEAFSNVFIGFVTTLMLSPAIYWLCDVKIKASQQLSCTALFTIVSLLRSYVIRRWFNKETGNEVAQGEEVPGSYKFIIAADYSDRYLTDDQIVAVYSVLRDRMCNMHSPWPKDLSATDLTLKYEHHDALVARIEADENSTIILVD